MKNKFWMVWRKDDRTPVFQHETLECARREAERMAEKHPGAEFIVLEAVSVSTTKQVKTYPLIDKDEFPIKVTMAPYEYDREKIWNRDHFLH